MRLRWWITISAALSVLSFAVLYYIVINVWPDPNTILAQPHVLFLAFTFMGLTTATVPITAYLNYRFAKSDWLERDKIRLLRQGLWVGLLGVLLAYIQLLRALNWAIGAVLLGVFIFVELFFLTR